MCYNPMRIKSSSQVGPQFMYVPCGHCEECCNSSRNAWSWRLQAEFQQRFLDGWKCGFATLTYGDDLPTIDPELLQGDSVVSGIPCFRRSDVTDFIKAVRKYVHRHYGVKSLSYMVCSEFGSSSTHRPHYHILLSWPENKCLDKCDLGNSLILDAQQMHRIVVDCWRYRIAWSKLEKKYVRNERHGFVFPRYYTGGFDGAYYHKPFQIDSPTIGAAKYAAKYCCKDLGFYDFLTSQGLKFVSDDDMKSRVRDCKPFHVQSRSLGFRMIANYTDEQKLKLFEDGFSFLGDKDMRFQSVPLYIRNKLFFSPDYILASDGRRLVRRNATEFFYKYHDEIFDRKVCFYSDLLLRLCNTDYWLGRKCSSDFAMKSSARVRELLDGYNPRSAAADFVAYYGVVGALPARSFMPPSEFWFSRYTDFYRYVDADTGELCHRDGESCGNENPRISEYMIHASDFDNSRYVMSYEESDLIRVFWTEIFELLSCTNGSVEHDYATDIVREYFKDVV